MSSRTEPISCVSAEIGVVSSLNLNQIGKCILLLVSAARRGSEHQAVTFNNVLAWSIYPL